MLTDTAGDGVAAKYRSVCRIQSVEEPPAAMPTPFTSRGTRPHIYAIACFLKSSLLTLRTPRPCYPPWRLRLCGSADIDIVLPVQDVLSWARCQEPTP